MYMQLTVDGAKNAACLYARNANEKPDNFQFEILETVQFSEIQEVFDIEDIYMIKFNSIQNGFNTRRTYETQI